MAAPMELTFKKAVEGILESWTALRIAVQQGFGGGESAEKAKWLVEAIVQWMNENSDVEPDELEDCIADILNAEFELLIEDSSLQQVSRDICECQRLCRQGKDVSRFFSLPKAPLDQSVKSPISDDVALSDDDDDDDDDEDDSVAGANNRGARNQNQRLAGNFHGQLQPRDDATASTSQATYRNSQTESSSSGDPPIPMDEDDSEWTVVNHRKK